MSQYYPILKREQHVWGLGFEVDHKCSPWSSCRLLTQIWRPWPRYVEAWPRTEAAPGQTGPRQGLRVSWPRLLILPPSSSHPRSREPGLVSSKIMTQDFQKIMLMVRRGKPDDTNHNMFGIFQLSLKPTFYSFWYLELIFNDAFSFCLIYTLLHFIPSLKLINHVTCDINIYSFMPA